MSRAFLSRYRETCDEYDVRPRPELMVVLEEGIREGIVVEEMRLNGNSVELFHNRIKDFELFALAEALETHNIFSRIDLSFNLIEDAGATALSKVIRNVTSLISLDLSGNNISAEGAKSISNNLIGNSHFRQLSLRSNPISEGGGNNFARMLKENEVLEELDLGNCDLKTTTILHLANVLQSYNTSLLSLNISSPLLFSEEEETTLALAHMLRENNTLEHLGLAQFRIQNTGADWIANAMKSNTALRTLDLSGNLITMDGHELLADMLRENQTLQNLDLSYNRVDLAGAVAYADALRENEGLCRLYLNNCTIPDRGLAALGKALLEGACPSLRRLQVWGNFFDVESAGIFRRVEQELPALKLDIVTYLVDESPQVAKAPN